MKILVKYRVYNLYSLKDNNLYIGFTTDIKRRIAEHQSGNLKSTAPRRPLKLIFCKYYLSKEDAIRREKYFKTTAGKNTIKLMLRESLKEINPE